MKAHTQDYIDACRARVFAEIEKRYLRTLDRTAMKPFARCTSSIVPERRRMESEVTLGF
jgi:hypothetical protein